MYLEYLKKSQKTQDVNYDQKIIWKNWSVNQ